MRSVNDETVMAKWYDGLGEEYRKTRGKLASINCVDNPELRRRTYLVISLLMAVVSAALISFAILSFLALSDLGFRKVATVTALVCIVLALFAGSAAMGRLKAAGMIKAALGVGNNTDLADPFRMTTMRRAYRWGEKRRLFQRR